MVRMNLLINLIITVYIEEQRNNKVIAKRHISDTKVETMPLTTSAKTFKVKERILLQREVKERQSLFFFFFWYKWGPIRWCGGKESACLCRRWNRCGFDLWIRKIPWRRKQKPIPVFLPRKFMDRGVWQATVHGAAMSRMLPSDWACTHTYTY